MTGRVFRSIAPQNNRPKNLPVHGLNVLAFARIQTSSNGGFATRRKGCAPGTRNDLQTTCRLRWGDWPSRRAVFARHELRGFPGLKIQS